MKKFLLAVIVCLFGYTSPALASAGAGYPGIELQSDGALLQTLPNEPALEQAVVFKVKDAKIVFNHLGDFAFESPLEHSSDGMGGAVTVTSSNSVEIVWNNDDSLSGSLLRDGIPVTVLDGKSSYFDDNLEPGSVHQYELMYNIQGADSGATSSPTFAISGTTVQLAATNTLTSITALVARSQASYSVLRYLTFIRDKYVPTPSFGCLPFGTHFVGNDRLYNPYATSQDSKTILTVRVDWATQTGEYWNYVGPTTMVTRVPNTDTYLPTYYDQGSSDGVYAYATRPILSTSAEIQMVIEAANPDCLGLPIYANLHVLLKPTGNYFVTGEVRYVPYHEFYLYQDNTGNWSTIYRKSISSLGFNCFNPFNSESSGYHCINSVTMSTGGTVVVG